MPFLPRLLWMLGVRCWMLDVFLVQGDGGATPELRSGNVSDQAILDAIAEARQ